MRKFPFLLLAALTVLAKPAFSAVGLTLWHSLGGAPRESLEALVREFNDSQKEYRVTAVYRDDPERVLAGPARSGPHMVVLPQALTAAMLDQPHRFLPAQKLIAAAGVRITSQTFYAPVADYYRARGSRLAALPLGAATPVFLYNEDAFAHAGLNPRQPPSTWHDVQNTALALQSAGVRCAYTTSWPAWIHLENLAAWDDQPIATHANGFDGKSVRLVFNDILMTRHVALLSAWRKSRLFTYAGRADRADAMFASGECAMLTTSSSAYPAIAGSAHFRVGAAPMPYYDEIRDAPRNSITDGVALWALAGAAPRERRGVGAFFAFLLQPQVQAQWHRQSGFLPAGPAAFELARAQGYYAERPAYEVFVQQLTHRSPGPYSRGLRVIHLRRLRELFDSELEAVWQDRKTPIEALEDAVAVGNRLIAASARSRLAAAR